MELVELELSFHLTKIHLETRSCFCLLPSEFKESLFKNVPVNYIMCRVGT